MAASDEEPGGTLHLYRLQIQIQVPVLRWCLLDEHCRTCFRSLRQHCQACKVPTQLPFRTPISAAFSLGSMLICLYMPRYVHFCLCLAADRSKSYSILMVVPKIVHRLDMRGWNIQNLACHPILPILASIFSSGWILCLCDARSYR
jgi:hypothetical protein